MRYVHVRQQQRDHAGLRYVCGACGHPERPEDRLTLTRDGMRVHRSHVTDPKSGLYGDEQTG